MEINEACSKIVKKLDDLVFDVYERADELKALLTLDSIITEKRFKELRDEISKDAKYVELINMIILIFTMEARMLNVSEINKNILEDTPLLISANVLDNEYVKLESLSNYGKVLYVIIVVLNLTDKK